MRSHPRKVGRRATVVADQERAVLRTLTLLIPRTYNADGNGSRKRIELSKLVQTVREMRQLFSGYVAQGAMGWYRNIQTGKQFRDSHFRFDIDVAVTPTVIDNLRKWKIVLENRFQQQAIYMKLSERIIWL